MDKTRMGISAGVMAATIYFMGLFGGYFLIVMLVAYVLLFEKDKWLKYNAIRAVALMLFFSLITTVISILPNAVQCIDKIVHIFDAYFNVPALSVVVDAFNSVINFIKEIFFIILGIKALKKQTIVIPIVDKVISKYIVSAD